MRKETFYLPASDILESVDYEGATRWQLEREQEGGNLTTPEGQYVGPA